MGELFRRLQYLLNRRRLDRELAADMEVHREMAAREGGIPLGNALHLREEAREAWGWTWIDRLLQDLRYAGRMLRRSPGFTSMAVLMLAVGTGVNIAAFGFFDFMVLRPLNVREPATLVRLHRRAQPNYSFVLPYPEMAFIREYSKTLSAVLALNHGNLTMDGGERPLRTQFVSPNWFSELGARRGLGRMLDPTRDSAADAGAVVVLSHTFWQGHFGGDPSVVGRVIRLNGKPATVIGVASPAFPGLSLEQPDLWALLGQQPYFAAGSTLLTDFSADSSGVETWGRLAPGATPRAAEEELRSLAAVLHRQHPKEIWEKENIPAEPSGYAESLIIGGRRGTGTEERDNIYPAAAMIGTLTLLILAVACGNLGSLLLARGVARDREIAIRVAVGAGRWRLVRQLLTESLLLALMGSAAGLIVGNAILRILMRFSGSPAWLDPSPDWRILAFALGVGCAAAILFGFTPALQIARQRHRATAMRQVLIAAQVAASCVLLIVSALLVRALDHATAARPGIDYQRVLAIDPQLGGHGYSAPQARAFLDTIEGRLRGLPGVESVSFTDTPPFGNVTRTAKMDLDGRVVETSVSHVDAEYFRTMGIPLLAGRNLAPGEANAVIVSRSLARRLWPLEDPLGKQLPLGQEVVVGIAGDARVVKLEDPDLTEIYFAAGPADLPGMTVLVKSVGETDALLPLVASIVKSIDAKVIPAVDELKNMLGRKVTMIEYGALAVSVLGMAALGLACLGIVGIVAYAVSQRRKEIGIRLALGAGSGDVITAILWQFSVPVAAGLALGVGGAAGLSSVLRRVLYGVSGLDPAAYASAVALFVLTVALAAWLPARRALRVDPMRALRCD
jgi:predicted permease